MLSDANFHSAERRAADILLAAAAAGDAYLFRIMCIVLGKPQLCQDAYQRALAAAADAGHAQIVDACQALGVLLQRD